MENETVLSTRDFKLSFNERIKSDADFRAAILQEIHDCLLAHDLQTVWTMLGDFNDAIPECRTVDESIQQDLKDLAHAMEGRTNFTEFELDQFASLVLEIKKRMVNRSLDKSKEHDWGIDR